MKDFHEERHGHERHAADEFVIAAGIWLHGSAACRTAREAGLHESHLITPMTRALFHVCDAADALNMGARGHNLISMVLIAAKCSPLDFTYVLPSDPGGEARPTLEDVRRAARSILSNGADDGGGSGALETQREDEGLDEHAVE